MAKIKKYHSGILSIIKHNLREFKNGECPTNAEVDLRRSSENYSLIKRGNTAYEVNQYRKSVEKECFQYNRKNLVRANEVIFSMTKDCPVEMEKRFFEESLNYLISTLPMGERCIVQAVVHRDEGHVYKDGKMVACGAPHMHVLYVPAVRDEKHPGYEFKLCSDALTKYKQLKEFHPRYQQWLNDANIPATVYSRVTKGKGVSVKALKEFSKEVGLSLEEIKTLSKENQKLHTMLQEKEKELMETRKQLNIEKQPWGSSTWNNKEYTKEEKLW